MYELFGYFAAVTLTFMNVPLVYDVFFQNKDHPSTYFMVLSLMTSICFTIYGIGIAIENGFIFALPMLIANPCSFISISMIFVHKLYIKNIIMKQHIDNENP